MTYKILTIFKIALLVFYSTYLFAGFPYSSRDLRDDCREAIKLDDNREDYSVSIALAKVGNCYGYIQGITDAHIFYAQLISDDGLNQDEVKKHYIFCMDEGVTRVQIARIIVKYLDVHPEKLHYSTMSNVYAALIENFPCSKNTK